MTRTKKIVATALSAAMAASMCVAVPATAAFAADANGTATATDGTQDDANLVDINDEIKSTFVVSDKFYNDGKPVEPLASINSRNTESGNKLVAGTDYDVTYSNNTELGTATAVITGKGKYKGTKTFTFKIINFTFDVLYEGKTLGSLSKAQIEKLTKESTDNESDLYYQYGKDDKNYVCYVPAKTYLTVATIMKAEGVAAWGGVKVTATDNMGTTVTAADDAQKKFFPGQTVNSTSITDGATDAPAVIADSYSEAKVTTTAGEAAAEAKAAYATNAKYGQSKVFTGVTEADYLAYNMPGMRLIGDICRFNILGEYSMLKSNPAKVAKAKATVKKGKSVAVKVSKAQGKVTVSTSAKKVAKVSYSKKTGKVTIKGLKKGKATVTVKAAGNKTYKAGTKTIKVTVK